MRSFLKATILARKKARLKEKHPLLQRIIYNVCLAFAKYAETVSFLSKKCIALSRPRKSSY